MNTLSLKTGKPSSSYDILFCVNILENTYFDLESVMNVEHEARQKMPRDSYSQYERMFYEREIISGIDACLMEISGLIKALDDFPASYNQLLLKGSLNYCEIALKEMMKKPPHNSKAFQYIQEYVLSVRDFYKQHKDKDRVAIGVAKMDLQVFEDRFDIDKDRVAIGVAKMDLQVFEDRFDIIQKLCHEKGILPPLNEMSLDKYPG